MASANEKQTWSWNNFRWGWSDDPFLGAEGTFSASKNIDTRNSPRGAILNSILRDTQFLGNGNIVGIKFIGDAVGASDSILAWTDTGKVYEYKIQDNTWALKIDVSGTADSNKKIYNLTTFYVPNTNKTYIYLWTQTYVHRCEIDYSNLQVDFANYLGVDDGQRALNNNGVQIIFGSGYLIYAINNTWNLDVETSKVQYNEVITGITLHLDQYRIYTRSYLSDTSTFGRQYIWKPGKIGTLMTYVVQWPNLPIKSVANDGAIDYVVAGSNEYFSSLYKTSGADKLLIKRWKEGTSNGFIGKMDNFKGLIFVGGSENLYSYGTLLASIQPAFTQEIALLEWETITWITSTYNKIYLSTATHVYAYDRSTTQGNSDGFALNGEITSQWFNAGTFYAKKKVNEIIVEHKLSEGQSIELYCRTWESDGWTLIKTIDYDSVNPENNEFTRIHSNDIESLVQTIFSKIQFKAKLIGEFNNLNYQKSISTPTFYGTHTFFDFINT